MTKEELVDRLTEICDEFDRVNEEDRQFIDPSARQPITMSLGQLEEYAKNFERRKELTKALNQLASETID